MEEHGFYIVLPSNVQPDYHPKNTAGCYQTTFPSSYQLPGKWEVALTEISYVNAIPTIVNESFVINSSTLDTDGKKYAFKVEGSKYLSPKQLADFNNSWKQKMEEKKKQEKKKQEKKEQDKMSVLEKHQAIAEAERDKQEAAAEAQRDKQTALSVLRVQSGKFSNNFTPKKKDCPFTVTFNKTKEVIEIKAVKEDLPPNYYLFHLEAERLKLSNPNGRKIVSGKYHQLWTSTLKKGEIYSSKIHPQTLTAPTIEFKEKKTKCLTVAASKGYYPSAEKLVEALNQETKHPLADWEKSEKSEGTKACGYRFAFNKAENRIMLGLTETTDLTFHGNLHTLLGFEKSYYTETRQTAKHAPLMNQGIYHIYIYCDLCAPIRVGNMLVPLLRTVDMPSGQDWGKVTSTRFERPMYAPIDKSSFNSVKIELYDDTGTPIAFSEGRTVVTLHIRPQRS